jgi:peptide deformylase
LTITQLGQPVLRQSSKPVRRIDAKIQRLIDDMIVTMKKARGVGIAAPQVGVGLRVFIVAPEPSRRYPHAPSMPPAAMINPRLLSYSKEMETDWEGCLSIPGIRGRVPRAKKLKIAFTGRDGKGYEARLSGFVARIFQHEFDHINGQVFMDRVQDTRTFATEPEYQRMLRRR